MMPSIAGLKTTEWNTSRGEIPAIPALHKPLAESTTSAATKKPGIWACHHKKGTQREEHEHAVDDDERSLEESERRYEASASSSLSPPRLGRGANELSKPGRNVAVQCISRSPSPALAIVCLRGAVWWLFSARAIATLRRSCRSHCQSRRCRLLAAPVSLPARAAANMKAQNR